MAMWAFEEAERFEKSQPKIEYYTMSYNFYKDAFASIKGRLFDYRKCFFSSGLYFIGINWYKI